MGEQVGESFPVYPKRTRLRDTGRGKYDRAMDVLGDYGRTTDVGAHQNQIIFSDYIFVGLNIHLGRAKFPR